MALPNIFAAVWCVWLCTAHAYKPQLTGPAWQNHTAESKALAVQELVTFDARPETFPTIGVLEIFVEDLKTTFTHAGDDMPEQYIFNNRERPKVIHTVGAIGRGKWIDLGGHNFTGIFRGGSDDMFVRFGPAKAPQASPPHTVPGLSLKFMRSGTPSANIMAMYTLLGQASHNFFAHDLSNHPPSLDLSKVDAGQAAAGKAFKKISAWPNMLGLSDMARFDAQGREASPPVFPFRIVFHPTADVHKAFPDDVGSEFTSDYFLHQLSTLAADTVLFEVYAQPTPFSDALTGPIARVQLQSQMTSSHFGDRHMFLQHTFMEADMAYHPEWVNASHRIHDYQAAHTPYAYPDLPWH